MEGGRSDLHAPRTTQREDPMKRMNVLFPALLATVAVCATAATSTAMTRSASAAPVTTRSGTTPALANAPASTASTRLLRACADDVFANGLDDDTRGDCASGTTGVTVYTDRDAFIAALAAGHIENAFDEVSQGACGGLRYADGGFNYLVYTEFGASGALYNGPGFVSTDRVDDQIWVSTTLDDAPITAIGGNVWSSDFSLRPTGGSIELTLVLQDGSIGATQTIDSTGPGDFRAFTSKTTPIAYLIIDAPDLEAPPPGTTPDRWPTLDNLIIGSAQ
jgi:hypothetical protein